MDKGNGLLVYPDPITNLGMLSGAIFLYFRKPLILTLPPQVITEESFQFISFVKEKKPYWEKSFFQLLNAWQYQQIACQNTLKSLEPLRNNIMNLWVIYPARIEELDKTITLISSRDISVDFAFNYIEPINASGELIRHLLLEVFLSVDKDISRLYQYCEDVFFKQPLKHLLVKGYLLRLLILTHVDDFSHILLTNEPIWDLLFGPKNNDLANEHSCNDIDKLAILDVVAWEIFRQIISPILDPLEPSKIKFIADLLNTRQKQVIKLHNKCTILAEKLVKPNTLKELISNVEKLVRSELQEELSDLLEIDKKAMEELLVSLFFDEKTWLGLFAFILGLVNGETIITTTGAISALSLFTTKVVKVSANRIEKLKRNPFGLVYTISRKTKLKYQY